MKAVEIFKYFFALIFILVTSKNMQAQVIDADTIMAVTKNVKAKILNTKEIHSPSKATKYSAILPGLGQAYNKKYWKIPIVYAGLGVVGYFAQWNNKEYKFMKRAYIHLTDTIPTTTDYLKIPGVEEYFDLSNPSSKASLETTLIKWQAYHRRNRDLLVILTFGVYVLNIIDASVDAHLFNFDISDDLSMNWQPSMLKFNNELVYGVNFSFNF